MLICGLLAYTHKKRLLKMFLTEDEVLMR